MKKESIFDNRTFLMVLSVIMAFLAWLFVSMDSNDTKGKTITGVTVDMQEVDESIGKLGLSTISTEQIDLGKDALSFLLDAVCNVRIRRVLRYLVFRQFENLQLAVGTKPLCIFFAGAAQIILF